MKAVLAVLAFGLLAGQAQCAGLAKSGFMERVMSAKNTGASSMESSKLYWEGDNMRIEEYSVDQLVVRIKKGSTLYIYVPAEKKAIKTTIPAGQNGSVQQMLQDMASPIQGGKKVGTAKVAGIACNVFAISGKAGNAKAYVSTDGRLPVMLRMQRTMGAVSQTIETRQIKLNYNVPDTMFTLPKGTTVKEEKFPEAPKQAPPASKK